VRMRGDAFALVTTLIGALLLAGCTATGSVDPTGGQRLTQAQAERLAVVRFNNFNAGVKHINASLDDQGTTLTISGWFDYSEPIGYAAVSGQGGQSGTPPEVLLRWDAQQVAQLPSMVNGSTVDPPLPIPDADWVPQALDPSTSTVASAIAMIANLGADRPENPQLLVQSDARWLRKDAIDGDSVDVFRGPSTSSEAPTGSASNQPMTSRITLQYWVDSKGDLKRLEILSPNAAPSAIDITDTAAVKTGALPPLSQ
jgi:hypothetical protein